MAYAIMMGAGIKGKLNRMIGMGLMGAVAITTTIGLCVAPADLASTMVDIDGTMTLTETGDHIGELVLNPFKEGQLASACLLAAAGILFVGFLAFVVYQKAEDKNAIPLVRTLVGGISVVVAAGMSTHIITKCSHENLVGDNAHGPWLMFSFLTASSLFGLIALSYLLFGSKKEGFNKGLLAGNTAAFVGAVALSVGCLDMMMQFSGSQMITGTADGGVPVGACFLFCLTGLSVLAIMGIYLLKKCGPADFVKKIFNMED